ncbi:hypothetical protein ATC00_10875 [Sinorhizobium americanum]|nr:hypothetical protein ATC00_10875 [Sinorhizobium americanum]
MPVSAGVLPGAGHLSAPAMPACKGAAGTGGELQSFENCCNAVVFAGAWEALHNTCASPALLVAFPSQRGVFILTLTVPPGSI